MGFGTWRSRWRSQNRNPRRAPGTPRQITMGAPDGRFGRRVDPWVSERCDRDGAVRIEIRVGGPGRHLGPGQFTMGLRAADLDGGWIRAFRDVAIVTAR